MEKLKFIIGWIFISLLPIVMVIVTLIRYFGDNLSVYQNVKENYGIIMLILFIGTIWENFVVTEELEND